MAADLLETIAIWRRELAQASDDNLLDSDRAETLSILDAAESHARLLRLLAEMDPRASYRIPACDALEAVEADMARERGGKERGT